ncbi:MAG: hypothetical protein A2Y82_02400, partial [Candidatus Buchananbacteria bacterium RBG_13_36_9]
MIKMKIEFCQFLPSKTGLKIMFNFLKNSFVLISGNLLAGFLGYVFHLIISRLLSVSGYGELQSLVSLISILAVPSAVISYFTIKHSAAYYAKNDYLGNFAFYKWLRTKIYKIILGLTLLFLVFMPLLKAYLHLNNYYNLIFTWLIVIIGLFISLKTGILSGWQDFKKLSLNSVLNAIFKLLIGITMVYIFASVPAALGGFLAAGLFSFFFLQKIIKKKAKANFNIHKTAESNEEFDRKKIFSEIKKVVWPILFFTFLISLFNSLDMLMAKNLLSSDLAGFYGAYNILGKIIFWASSSIIAVILPIACAHDAKDQPVDRKILYLANGLIIFICSVGLIAYLTMPEIIIGILFGSRYLPW